MKNIFTKNFILTLVSVFIAIIVIIISCKKMDDFTHSSDDSHRLLPFYSKSLIASLKNEPIVKEFYQEMNRIPIKINNGILSFNSVEDVNAMYDLITQYSDKFDVAVRKDSRYSQYAKSDHMPADPIAYLFETKLGFNSLRINIEEEILILERGNGILDDNDPDDHYTVSPYMRTVLSPDCEIIVDDLICVHYDKYAIGIMYYDWATLKELHEWQKKYNSDEKKAIEFCLGKQNAFLLTTGSEPTLHVDYTYTRDPNNPETIQFHNYSCSETYKDMKYLWDFGDGITSTERNPTHTFAPGASGNNVCLTVNLPNNSKGGNSKGPTVYCNPIPPPPSPPNNNNLDFAAYEGANGLVYFQCTKPGNNLIAKYIWKYAPSIPEQTIYNDPNTTYLYLQNGDYNVTLTVQYYNTGLTESRTKKVTVKKVGVGVACCNGNEREVKGKKEPYDYNGNSYRVKQVLRITNAFWAHKMVGKTKLQVKKSGAWYGADADEINIGFIGTIYLSNPNIQGCGDPYIANDWHPDGDQTNTNKVVWDHGFGTSFNVAKNTLHSKHYVKHGGVVRINGIGPSLDPCK